MKFNDSAWPCCDALVHMFFTDCPEIRTKGAARTRLLNYLQCALDSTESRLRIPLPEEQLKLIRKLVPCVRKHPAQFSSDLQLPPIAWMKIGIQLGAMGMPLSDYFLERYLKWRTLNHQAERLALVVQRQRRSGDFGQSAVEHPDVAYALDVFLLADIQNFNQSPHNWKVRYRPIDLHERAVESTRRQNRGSPKKTPVDQVGKGVFEETQQCIQIAADQRLIAKELLRKSPDGRFVFSGSRQELLVKLRRKFRGKLQGSDRVRLQAISLVAACGRYRRARGVNAAG